MPHSNAKRWIDAFTAMAAPEPVAVIPGHGSLTDLAGVRANSRDYDVQSPNVFLNHLFDLNQVAFCKAVHGMRKRLHNPVQTAEELLITFYKQELPMTVKKLENVIKIL